MKKWFRAMFFTAILAMLCAGPFETDGIYGVQMAEAHSGRTDSSGGHHDYRNVSGLGSYHYHCGGHPAHLHSNGRCPYAGSAGGNTAGGKTSSPRISRKSAKVYAGESLTLKVSGASGKVRWSSSKTSVAVVNTSGKVTAKKKGTVVITALAGSKKLTCRVTVQPLALNKNKLSLQEDESASLTVKGTSQKVKWSSSNQKIAAVNSKGKVTAKNPGMAVITAAIGKQKLKCKVTVKKRVIPIEDFYIDEYGLELKEGHTAKIAAIVEPSNATNQNIKWTSSNPQVATVSQGVVTGKSVGTAVITASCGNYSDHCYVTVEQDFVEIEAKNALSYLTYRCGDEIIAEVTSRYRYPMALEGKCRFYDTTGRLLWTDYNKLNCLETGQTLCMSFNVPYSDSVGTNFTYELDFTPEQSSYTGAASSIAHTETPASDRLSVHLNHKGTEELYLLNVSVAFFKNGQAMRCESRSLYGIWPGKTDCIYFDYPYNDGNILVPEEYRIFIEAGSFS